MNRQQRRDGLHFDNDEILDDEIDVVARIEWHSFVEDWNTSLNDEAQLSRRELKAETWHVDRFQQPGSQRAVHLNRAAKNQTCDVVECGGVDRHGARRECKARTDQNSW